MTLATSLLLAACGSDDPGGPAATATVSGVVRAAAGAVTEGPIQGASVTIGSASAISGADGRFELRNVPVGSGTISSSAPGFASRSEVVSVVAGTNTHEIVLTPTGQ